MMNIPSPINNPTLKGFDILHTSPAVQGSFGHPHRALVVRYSDPTLQDGKTFIVWQEQFGNDWHNVPGSDYVNCHALIIALLSNAEEA